MATMVLLAASGGAGGFAAQAQSEGRAQSPESAAFRVIQGRITGITDNRITVKTPDGYPGGPGIHAQFVSAGPALDVDVSDSKILLPDGRRPDTRPLAAGDRVVVVLSGAESGSGAASKYRALVIERVAAGDKIVSH